MVLKHKMPKHNALPIAGPIKKLVGHCFGSYASTSGFPSEEFELTAGTHPVKNLSSQLTRWELT